MGYMRLRTSTRRLLPILMQYVNGASSLVSRWSCCRGVMRALHMSWPSPVSVVHSVCTTTANRASGAASVDPGSTMATTEPISGGGAVVSSCCVCCSSCSIGLLDSAGSVSPWSLLSARRRLPPCCGSLANVGEWPRGVGLVSAPSP